jgi:hypothetical protein
MVQQTLVVATRLDANIIGLRASVLGVGVHAQVQVKARRSVA